MDCILSHPLYKAIEILITTNKYDSMYKTAVNAVQNTTGRVQWRVQI